MIVEHEVPPPAGDTPIPPSRLILWPLIFVATLTFVSRIVHSIRRHVWFDCPPHWPCSIFNPRGPHGAYEYVALVLSVAVGAATIIVLSRLKYAPGLVALAGLTLIVLSNAIQGVPKGFFNPIAGGHAPEQYYHDSRNVESPAEFLNHFAQIQPALHTHARTHPPGAVLIFFAMTRTVGDHPAAMALIIAVVSTLLSAAAIYRLTRNVLGASSELAGFGALLYLFLPSIQIYYCATLDALIGTFLLCAITAWSEPPRASNTLVACAFIAAASWLTFGFVWIFPVIALMDAVQRRWIRWLWPVLGLVTLYAGLHAVSNFDYLLGARTASHLENPRGFRLLVEPISYTFTRIEDCSEILVFLGPFLIALLFPGISILRREATARPAWILFVAGVSTLTGVFLTGAFHTGETARACLFIYPVLLIPVLVRMRSATARQRSLLLALVLAQSIGMQTFANFFW